MYGPVGFRILKIFLGILFFVLGPMKVVGKNRVPKQGGLLILANHLSDVDPPAMGNAIPRMMFFMAKSELFDVKILGKIIRYCRAFPVKRGRPDRSALQKSIDLLREGNCVVIFPEGEISEDGKPIPLQAGVSLIIRKAKVPVLCCGLIGTDRIMPFGKIIPRPAFGGVRAIFGEVKQFEEETDDKPIMAWINQELETLTGQRRPEYNS